MGISVGTALEIFTNPDDLEITIAQRPNGGEFSFGISRGPGHNFKPLVFSRPFAKKPEEVVEVVRAALETVHRYGTDTLTAEGSPLARFLNPDSQEIEQSKVLTPNLIDRILGELREKRVASTYTMGA